MQRRFYDAEKVILKIAYGNNMKPPPHLYTKLEEIANEDAKPKSYAMYDLLRTWRFSKHYLNIWLNLYVLSFFVFLSNWLLTYKILKCETGNSYIKLLDRN